MKTLKQRQDWVRCPKLSLGVEWRQILTEYLACASPQYRHVTWTLCGSPDRTSSWLPHPLHEETQQAGTEGWMNE